MRWTLTDFLRESLRIEGITREPTPLEIAATESFLKAEVLSVTRLKALLAVYAPHAVLRDKRGRNVRVGNHVPPPGGPEIKERLQSFVEGVNAGLWDAYRAHIIFETLHPFTDGNGRTGRAIWAWQMVRKPSHHTRLAGTLNMEMLAIGFLHRWYYDSLDRSR